jgi:hypothetical protein
MEKKSNLRKKKQVAKRTISHISFTERNVVVNFCIKFFNVLVK